MKCHPINTFAVLVAAVHAAFAPSALSQTTFNGGDLGDAGNWTNGLPTSPGNPGSIAVNGTLNAGSPAVTYTDYYITQTDGVISYDLFGQDPRLSGGTFEQNGGTWGVASGGRGFRQENSNVTTLTSGKIISGTNGGTSINNGSTLVVNGGSLETYGGNRGILLSGGGTLTINGGSVFTATSSATNIFGIGRLATSNNFINLNGGVTNVNFFGFGRNNSNSQLTVSVGGTTAGSFTAVDFVALSADELITERDIRWLPGSLMTMTVTNADEWAAAEWAADRLLFDGQSSTDLGGLTWADASNPSIGLGGGYYWIYDSGTETLSLGSGTPPPVSNPFRITSFSAVSGEPGVWQATLTGDASTDYIFRSSTTLDFTPGTLVENLTAGVPAAGAIGGTNDSVVTTNSSGEATVRMTLTGNPSDFVRAETAP